MHHYFLYISKEASSSAAIIERALAKDLNNSESERTGGRPCERRAACRSWRGSPVEDWTMDVFRFDPLESPAVAARLCHEGGGGE
ncbi:hypothetical protein NL676_006452 [Syzygium grande]|nr:hypothetical protein NL676_006452 [Syzygium grande]